jgi:hypothetical protein
MQTEIPLPSDVFYGFTVAVGRQRAMHTESSGFASPTLGKHISTFRGYINCIKFYVNCSALTGVYDWQ